MWKVATLSKTSPHAGRRRPLRGVLGKALGKPNLPHPKERHPVERLSAGDRRRGDLNRMISTSPISGAQLRAARALLKWSVRELSDRCHVSRSAISRGERVDSALAMQV